MDYRINTNSFKKETLVKEKAKDLDIRDGLLSEWVVER